MVNTPANRLVRNRRPYHFRRPYHLRTPPHCRQQVDLGRTLKATNQIGGAGLIGGRAVLETTGNSMATMLANGNGSLQLTMAGGGELSAL
jgi:hypothetical protein